MARQEGPGVLAPSMREPIGDFNVVSADEWKAAREKLLAEEKALMKAKDRLVAKRRLLPVTEVGRNYKFIGTKGDRDLLGLFEGRRQLVVYRFFYAPDVENWPDGACSGCSLFADTVVHPAHLAARDTTLAFVTAAPSDKIESLIDAQPCRGLARPKVHSGVPAKEDHDQLSHDDSYRFGLDARAAARESRLEYLRQ